MKKIFALDTNVLMHDPTCLFRFAEHDLFIPMKTLEELDNNKKGSSEVARNARQASRTLEKIIADSEDGIENGIPLDTASDGLATGRLFLQMKKMDGNLPAELAISLGDNQILSVITALAAEKKGTHDVILVSKDINMRIKARILKLFAEDYISDKVLEDTDLLYTGVLKLPDDFWGTHSTNLESWQEKGKMFYRVHGDLVLDMHVNQMVYLDSQEKPFYSIVRKKEGKKAILEILDDHRNKKHDVWGITARNVEQNFALNLLLDKNIDFVTLAGQAGSGKTLLTLAAALTQVLEGEKPYSEIIFTRVTVPVGEDIGFLPGTEEEKMGPWMGALEDNLDVLNHTANDADEKNGAEWGRAATRDLIRTRIKVKSLNFMRGRTFLNKFLIIDEAQNLTPKQMKTLITRAGPGTKVVCLGNIAQIDTPYLTEGSSGLTYVVDRFKDWPHSGHVTLVMGERSRLSNFANEAL